MSIDLEALLALHEEATPEPWYVGSEPGYRPADTFDVFATGGDGYALISNITHPDAALIVAMRNALPTLIADSERLAALEAGIEALVGQFDAHAKSDQNEARSKREDDPDLHYWEGCADANRQRADDLRALLTKGGE